MDNEIERLLRNLRDAEEALERKLAAGRADLSYRLEHGKAVFERRVVAEHRRLRVGLLRYLRASPIGAVITAPVVYSLVLPFALLDLLVAAYQTVCFPIWGIARVRRSDYVVFDRHRLSYLNAIEKLNCVYCGYANGVIALVREVASRTEQYWCPIKHALRVKGRHGRYGRFVNYGDAEGFREKRDALRDDVKRP